MPTDNNGITSLGDVSFNPTATSGTVTPPAPDAEQIAVLPVVPPVVEPVVTTDTPTPADPNATDDPDGYEVRDGDLYQGDTLIRVAGEFTIDEETSEVELIDINPVSKAISALKDSYDFPEDFTEQITKGTLKDDDAIIALVEEVGRQESINAIVELYNTYGELKDLALAIEAGKDIKEYYIQKAQATSYKEVNFDELPIEKQQEIAITSLMTVNNMDRATATEMINLMVDNKSFETRGKVFFDKLQQWEAVKVQEERETLRKQAEAKRDDTIKYWNQVKEIVTDGKLGTFTIPEKDRDAFFNWQSKAVDKQGNSQSTLDYNALSLAERIQLDFLRYKKFNLTELVDKAATTKHAAAIERRKVQLKMKGTGGSNPKTIVNNGAGIKSLSDLA